LAFIKDDDELFRGGSLVGIWRDEQANLDEEFVRS
jgi:hypothetical protein